MNQVLQDQRTLRHNALQRLLRAQHDVNSTRTRRMGVYVGLFAALLLVLWVILVIVARMHR